MIRRLVLLGAVAALTATTLGTANAGSSLSGSVYRGTTGSTSTALVGALVYVHPTDGSAAGPWKGPAVTDAFGRFTFSDLTPGKYALRIFVGRKRVWEQVVDAPKTLAPIVLPASTAS